MAKMKALVKRDAGARGLELLDVERPEPGDGDLLLRVEVAGICGSDMPLYRGEAPWLRTPRIPGHEWAGVVEKTGENVVGFDAGDRVTAEVLVACGGCPYCLAGRRNLCTRAQGVGFSRDGAFAEYILLPAGSHVHHVPDGVDLVEVAGAEPAAVALHGMSRTELRAGDLVAVVGPGTIGMYALQAALLRGAGVVVVGAGGDENRLELASNLGAAKTINAEKGDPREALDAFSGGAGADLVIESSGSPAGVATAYGLARRGGEVLQLGRLHGDGSVPSAAVDLIARNELSVHGAFAESWEAFEQALRLLAAQKIRTAPLVTHRLPLERAEEGFRAFDGRGALKVMLEPWT